MLVRVIIILVCLIYALSIVAVLTIPAPEGTGTGTGESSTTQPARSSPNNADDAPALSTEQSTAATTPAAESEQARLLDREAGTAPSSPRRGTTPQEGQPAAPSGNGQAGLDTRDATPPTSSDPREVMPQLVGIALNLYSTEDPQHYIDAVDEIAAMGFNTLHAITPVFQRNGAANEIERIADQPGRALARDQLVRVLRYAKQRGLITTLMPQVNFTAPRGNEWRGKIQPDRWRTWWTAYEQMIEEHLAIANEANVDVFIIGCELLSTQRSAHEARWRHIISMAREQFDGTLTYSTNWDRYQTVPFWDALDAIGISGYWDLTDGASDRDAPTDDELETRWTEIRETVLTYAKQQERPILLTEIGYPCLPWALRDPWNYVNPDDLAAAPQAQARGYQSFLKGWEAAILPPRQALTQARDTVNTPGTTWRLPDTGVAGVLFYNWDIYHAGGPEDTGYGIAGKPAYEILKAWFAGEASGPTSRR